MKLTNKYILATEKIKRGLLSISCLWDAKKTLFLAPAGLYNIDNDLLRRVETRINRAITLKFMDLNPNFSDEVYANMLNIIHGNIRNVPSDVVVVDDVVFLEEKTFSDYSVDDIVSMVDSHNQNGYQEVTSQSFILPSNGEKLSPENVEAILDLNAFVIEQLNKLLMPVAGDTVISPNTVHKLGYASSNTKVCINQNIHQIHSGVTSEEALVIKLIILHKGNYSTYEITQTVKNKVIAWHISPTVPAIWRLSEALKIRTCEVDKQKRMKNLREG